MQPDLILVPFAQDAPAVNVDAIPVNLGPSDPPQAASWSQGFPTVTMTPLAAGGIPPRGQSFNGVLQDITQHLVYIGGGGQYRWSAAYVAANGGYSIGDVIQADSGLLSYVSLVDNNKDNFNTTPASIGPKWRAWAGAPIPDATTSQRGAVLIATQSQANAGSGDAVLTPATRASAAQIQASCAFATTGTATAQILTPLPAISAYAANQRFNVTFNIASGTNPTINVSEIGPKSLKQYSSTGAKLPAAFSSGQNADIVFDGVDWILLNALPVDAKKIGAINYTVRRVITASSTYPPSPGMVYCDVEAVGGGGGGGGALGAASSSAAAGGGGAGGYCRKLFTAAQIGASQSVTIGAAGVGGAPGNNPGISGGATTFGALMTAGGGGGGGGSSSSTIQTVGGSVGPGGSASGGDINIQGASGLAGFTFTSGQGGIGGSGASGMFGAGGAQVGPIGSGLTATGRGAGGSGGAAANVSAVGGSGTAGQVVIIEYCSQ